MIGINVPGGGCVMIAEQKWEVAMTTQDMITVALILTAFIAFGLVLGFVSWDETRRTRRLKDRASQAGSQTHEKVHG